MSDKILCKYVSLMMALSVWFGCQSGDEANHNVVQEVRDDCTPTDDCQCKVSPLVIDADGDGFSFTSAASGVVFELKPGAGPQRVAWTQAGDDDAFVVYDLNDDGLINDGKEMFGDNTLQPLGGPRNGFSALARYDLADAGGNGDGFIDASDDVYGDLEIWRDVNHDGVSQPGELQPVSALGIESFTLSYQDSDVVDSHGNEVRYVSTIDVADGSTTSNQIVDVFFVRLPLPPTPIGGGTTNATVRRCTIECFSVWSTDVVQPGATLHACLNLKGTVMQSQERNTLLFGTMTQILKTADGVDDAAAIQSATNACNADAVVPQPGFPPQSCKRTPWIGIFGCATVITGGGGGGGSCALD